MKTLIFIERDHEDECLGLVALANQLAVAGEPVETYGLGIDLDTSRVSNLDHYLDVKLDDVNTYDCEQIAHIVAEAHERYLFDCVIVLSTSRGRMIAPRAAARLKAGLVTDVVAARVVGSDPVLVRPTYQGNRLASVTCQTRPMMIGAHPGTFACADRACEAPDVIPFTPSQVGKPRLTVLAVRDKPATDDITKRRVLVAGGAGVRDHFQALGGLAQLLGGGVAASRKLVDAGIAPRALQVGQSGKTVHPDVYIAIGISGMAQHLAGMKNAGTLISVNTDVGAPICRISDLVVEADGAQFIAKMTQRIKRG